MYIRKDMMQIRHQILMKLSLSPSQDNAYGETLRQHHGWVVRGVFAVSSPSAS